MIDDLTVKIIELAGQGTDTVQSSVSHSLFTNVENLTLSGTSAINGYGNASTNVITGNTANNIISSGGGGKDTLVGGVGNDTYIVTNTGVTITELTGEGTDLVKSSVNFTLGAFVDNLTLTGSAVTGVGNSLTNTITGNSKNNIINAGTAGSDTLIGGLGNDTYLINNSNVKILENSGEETDLVISSVDYYLDYNVENITLIGSSIEAQANSLTNLIIGNSNDNIIWGYGNAGSDTLIGGLGNDGYIIYHTGITIVENSIAGDLYDYVTASINYTLANNVENLTLAGSAIYGVGNSGNNELHGSVNANVLDGGMSGNDSLWGIAGNDTYIINHTGVYVQDAAGVDIVESSISYTLGNDIENLTLTGSGAINGKGNSLTNVILGNSKNNIIDGGSAGTDTLIGGKGNDTLAGGAGNDQYHFSAGDDLDVIAADGGGTNVVKILDAAKATIAVYVSTASNTLYLDYAADDTDILTIKNYNTAVSSIWDNTGSNNLTATQINAIIADIAAYNAQHAGVDTVQEVRTATQTDVTGFGGLTLIQKIAADWA